MQRASRAPTDYELALLGRLAEESDQQEVLGTQISELEVTTIDDYGSLALKTRSNLRGTFPRRVPVEAEGVDADGIAIHALLHVSEGAVLELEFYKDDGTPVTRRPSIEEWEVLKLPLGRVRT